MERKSYGGRFLYGNVVLRQIDPDEAEGLLTLQASYDNREYQTILYKGVYAGQFRAAHTGKRIVLAEELPLSLLPELCAAQDIARLFFTREHVLPEFLHLQQQMGYHLYQHYLDSGEECIVVAREIQISTNMK
ncbi:hypothetical protein [Sporomusa sp. KB1]|jgi:hypothetical protein|uniref:hypothetical protein n=1 Tax=Sporomusa sp. KB1 TaxID=943346 RepID=UPI00119CF2F1|nr:hypothetical protein [Sporomusa sp. KB1]TWH51995.1 hypothetical protein Salpa_0497 [Sporomusa sp. KB1]